jgi:hypothetical protein
MPDVEVNPMAWKTLRRRAKAFYPAVLLAFLLLPSAGIAQGGLNALDEPIRIFTSIMVVGSLGAVAGFILSFYFPIIGLITCCFAITALLPSAFVFIFGGEDFLQYVLVPFVCFLLGIAGVVNGARRIWKRSQRKSSEATP